MGHWAFVLVCAGIARLYHSQGRSGAAVRGVHSVACSPSLSLLLSSSKAPTLSRVKLVDEALVGPSVVER